MHRVSTCRADRADPPFAHSGHAIDPPVRRWRRRAAARLSDSCHGSVFRTVSSISWSVVVGCMSGWRDPSHVAFKVHPARSSCCMASTTRHGKKTIINRGFEHAVICGWKSGFYISRNLQLQLLLQLLAAWRRPIAVTTTISSEILTVYDLDSVSMMRQRRQSSRT